MIRTSITYLDADDQKKSIIVNDNQYDFNTSMPGVIISPYRTAIQFIPAERILSMLTTGVTFSDLEPLG